MKMKHKVLLTAGAVLVAMVVLGNVTEKLEAKRAEEAALGEQVATAKRVKDKREALVAEFQGNRSSLISEAQQLISHGDPAAAQQVLAKFAPLQDQDVTHLLKVAGDKLLAVQRIKKLSDELATNPDKVKAMAIHKELAQLEPANPLWKALIEENRAVVYAITAQQAATEKAAARTTAIKSLFSAWDGSVRSVEVGIKARLKDPDSYKHVKTSARDAGADGVLVVTEYRAKNSFNAVITSVATALVSPSGELISLDMKQ